MGWRGERIDVKGVRGKGQSVVPVLRLEIMYWRTEHTQAR